MKKTKLSILMYCAVGVLVGSSLGFGGYFIYKAITKKEKVYEGYHELGTPKTIWFNSGALNADESKANKQWDFQIKVFPYRNGKYWLDDDGLVLLRDEIKKKLYHGQEITTLDDIVFGNTNMIDETSNGLYFPLTKEMFLNVAGWEKHQSLSDEKKIKGIMSTIVHEYGHHIANMYLTTSYSSQSWDGDNGFVPTIEKEDGSRDLTNWNAEFTENFYRSLKYDDKTLLYGKGGIEEGSSPYIGREKESIAEKVSLHDLFWNANSDKKLSFNEDKQVFGLPGVSSLKNPRKRNYFRPKIWVPNHDWFVKYRYSLDEIVTRQLEQLMFVYDMPEDPDLFGHMIRGWDGKGSINYDSFVSDALATSQIYANSQNFQKASFATRNFYRDSVFRNTTETKEIYNNFRNAMGYHKMISNVYGLNKTFATVDKETGSKFANYDDGDLNQHRFKITGWTPKEVKGIYYGNDSSSSSKEINSKVMKFGTVEERKQLWNFDRKDSLFAKKVVDSNSFGTDKEGWLPFSTTEYLKTNSNYYSDTDFKWWIDKDNDGKAERGELVRTDEVLNKYDHIGEDDVINRVLPISTFRQAWNEGDIFPRIRYLTDVEDGRKKLFIRLY